VGRPRERHALVPGFGPSAAAALASVPDDIAEAAVRTVVALAERDEGAWHAVKKTKDMKRPLFLARVGYRHRLLFRVDGDALVVAELLSREGMDQAIKRLRSNH